jgi:hypothetical protein
MTWRLFVVVLLSIACAGQPGKPAGDPPPPPRNPRRNSTQTNVTEAVKEPKVVGDLPLVECLSVRCALPWQVCDACAPLLPSICTQHPYDNEAYKSIIRVGMHGRAHVLHLALTESYV